MLSRGIRGTCITHWWYQSAEKIGGNDAYPSQWISNMAPLSALAIHCSRIFLLASSRFLTIKTRGVLFAWYTPEVRKWKLKNGLENAMMSETHDAQKDSKMTTHQSAHFSSDNFSFNLAKIHKRGANKGRVYSIVQPTVLLQKSWSSPLKKHFLLKWKNCNEKLILLVRG